MRRIAAALMIVGVTTTVWAGSNGSEEMRILSFPIGLVSGEVPVDVDLGPSRAPASLYLDGTKVCEMSVAATHCMVDLGEDLHVHLLELIRSKPGGGAAERAARWVNRPGQEAEAAILLAPRTADGICGGRLLFSHPAKQTPVKVAAEDNGRSLRIGDDGRSFRYPCPEPDVPHLITAAAIFPDGARAEAVALSGAFRGSTDAGLSAVALVDNRPASQDCGVLAAALGPLATSVGDTGFEVVFVLDPRVRYRKLFNSGRIPMVDHALRSGAPRATWRRAERALYGAAALWFVTPDNDLSRADGFGNGRSRWLTELFFTGEAASTRDLRLADAVAASGLVAAARPRRRAVVLLLGDGEGKDVSTFTPANAQAYLAEVGVPLVVLRNGEPRADGWPHGRPMGDMGDMADVLDELRGSLDRQCVVWLPDGLEPRTIAAMLPSEVTIVGRGDGRSVPSIEDVRQRAEPTVATEASNQARSGVAARGEIDVTAATVLVRATDPKGRPVTDLVAGEVTVTEDSDPVAILGLERVAPRRRFAAAADERDALESTVDPEAGSTPPIPVVVYVDSRLAGAGVVSAALEKLEPRSDWLTSLGPVDLVVAGDDVATVLDGSRDADVLSSALHAQAKIAVGRSAIDLIRSRFGREVRKLPVRAGSDSLIPAIAANHMNVLVAARSAISEEKGAIEQTIDRLHRWADEKTAAGPRLLLLIGTAFDEDPRDFYLPFVESLEPMNLPRASEEFRDLDRAEAVTDLGRDLAAAGWTVVPVAASSLNVGISSTAAEVNGSVRFQSFMSAASEPRLAPSAGWLQVDPVAAQEHVALPSGGTVAFGDAGIEALVKGSAGWYRLTYQVDRIPDGQTHDLAITCSRPDIKLLSPRVQVTTGTSEDRSRSRLLGLLEGQATGGGLGVELALSDPVASDGGTQRLNAVVRVDFTALHGLAIEDGDRELRVSVAVDTGEDAPFVTHIPQSVASSVGRWEFSFPLVSPPGKLRVVVAVEDLATGLWGAATGEVPE